MLLFDIFEPWLLYYKLAKVLIEILLQCTGSIFDALIQRSKMMVAQMCRGCW